eukprot:TRINITY_DN52006_c0_g1_i1.p1 TRINITY_DN52006_c0_g1~~TRINITY_DN52006_c0_g1_i1.p1  ORF type:complete len:434 (-),score=12.37 TRINITY_DN52006_c0_g1_i1:52-1353(-)
MLARTFLRRFPQNVMATQAVQASSSVGNIKAAKSNNGVQLLCKENVSNLVSLKFAVLGGASAETEEEKGAAHMLSVSAFAGTKNKNGIRLMRELEDIGATVSASADREKITIDVTVMSNMAELAFERVAETIVSPPKNNFVIMDYFGAAQLAYENKAKTPKHLLDELLHEAAYGEATPMGSSQFAEDLSQLKPESILSYRNHQYTANNLIIAGSGLTSEMLKNYTDKYLNDLSNTGDNNNNNNVTYQYSGGDAKLKGNFNGKTYVALAFPSDSKDKAYNVLKLLLQNKVNKVTDITKATGEVACFNAPYSKGGLWGVYVCGNSAEVSNKLINTAIQELKGFTNNVPTADLETVKNQLTLEKTAALESESVTCALLSSHMTSTAPSDYINFNTVTANDVQNAAKNSLKAVPTYAVLGKTAGVANYPTIMKLVSA